MATATTSNGATANPYYLPDPQGESETARLDVQHKIWLVYYDGGLFHRAITIPKDAKILDIGCGTGVWATDMARANPQCSVTGIDISPPTADASTPKNCRFERVDIQQEWSMHDKYDFIHIRYMMHVVLDWPLLFTRSWDMLKPGGWIQSEDFWAPYRSANPEMNVATSPFLLFGAVFEGGRESLVDNRTKVTGLDPRAADHHADRLRLQGFRNVQTAVAPWPLGEWAESSKEQTMGKMLLDSYVGLFRKVGPMVLQKSNSMSTELAEKLTKDMVRDLEENSLSGKYYFSMLINLAQKP